MDVEYIALETNETFICQGFVQNIGKNIILVRNYNRDGDIFIFNRKGKALKKINHLGQGGEEYTFILGITLDEDNNEMFINDNLSRKILVYDLEGNFRRSLPHKGDFLFFEMFNFDRENLICHDAFNDNNSHYIAVAKQQQCLRITIAKIVSQCKVVVNIELQICRCLLVI